MNSRVTVANVARHLDLSPTTVGHVLNGRGAALRISAVTQARIQEAALEMGYRPNLSARSVRTGRFGCAALIQPLSGIYLPPSLLLGISEELHRHDMHLVISEVPQKSLSEAGFLPKVMSNLAADGLLINVLSEIPAAFEEELQRLQMPAIWINTKRPHDSVHPDDLAAAQRLTEYLLKMGHRNIVFARPEITRVAHYSEHDRYAGYEKAMRAAGLQPVVWEMPRARDKREEIIHDPRPNAALSLLSQPNRPTAIVAYEIEVAMPLYHAALRLSLDVPRDLSLAMFHGELNTQIGVPFTTMHLWLSEIGKQAVQILLQKIERPHELIPARALHADFFEGATCAPPH